MNPKKITLIILLVISFAISRFVFFLVNDPEGRTYL